MSAPKVLISDKLSEDAVQVFKDRGLNVDYKPGTDAETLLSIIGEYDGLAIRSATKVTPEVFAAAKKLNVVGRAGIGVDNIDQPSATQAGVVVMNTPFGNAVTTAEHAIALMFAAARQLPLANASTQAGKWEKSRFMGRELTGKTLGLIGAGNIGSIVAQKALGLGLKVIAFDPFLSDERAKDMGVEKVELDTLLPRADVITLHVPMTPQTKGLIGKDQIATMKKGAILVNAARGGLVDEAALKDALDSGHLGAAALDVFEVEPAKDNPLFGTDNLIATPHLGAATSEAQEKVAVQVAEQMSDYLLDGAITNALNAPSLSAEEARKLGPYLELSKQLGSLAGQLTHADANNEIKSVRFHFEGEAHGLKWAPLKQAMLQALIAPFLASVNMVNAEAIAKQRGIQINDGGNSQAVPYQTAIGIEVETAEKTRGIKGTLFAGTMPRIVEVKGIRMETELAPNMLYITNADKAGFIGALGTTLGKHSLNIASFHHGRQSEGGDAVSLVGLDAAPNGGVVKDLCGLDHVQTVVPLKFDVAG